MSQKSNDELLLNKLFVDIVNGYSTDNNIFVKHLNHFDYYKVQLIKNESLDFAISKGMPLEKDRLENLYKNKIWTIDDDNFLRECKMMIDGLIKNKKNLLLPSQIKFQEEEIKNWENKHSSKLLEKNEYLGMTAEKFAEERSSTFYIYTSLYKDKNLINSYFNDEQFQELDSDEFSDLIITYNKITQHISLENIKKISISENYLSLFNVNDNSYNFYGIPTVKLSYNQINLFKYLRYYNSILSELQDKIPEHIKNDPDKLENFYISSTNIEKEKNKRGNKAGKVEFFGSTSEDQEILDFNNKNIKDSDNDDELINKMLQKGESIGLMDLINHKK